MANHTKEQKATYMAKVRQIMVMRGATISGRDIVAILDKNGIKVSIEYAIKLRDKILSERKHRVERKLAAVHVSDFEDTNEEIISRCWDIILNKDETTHNKLMAMKEIREAKKTTMDALMDSGFFSRNLGEGKMIHELNPDTQKALEDLKDCLAIQFGERLKPVIYEEAIIHEQTNDKPEQPKSIENPNIKQLPNGAVVDTKGPNVIEV